MEQISLQDEADSLISQIQDTPTYNRTEFSNWVTQKYRSLMGRWLITPIQVKDAIKNAILITTNQSIEDACNSKLGKLSLAYYADHYLDTGALAYSLRYFSDKIAVDKICFDHWEDPEYYVGKSFKDWDYADFLYKKLLKPDPLSIYSSSGGWCGWFHCLCC